jgi:hypothetical protein
MKKSTYLLALTAIVSFSSFANFSHDKDAGARVLLKDRNFIQLVQLTINQFEKIDISSMRKNRNLASYDRDLSLRALGMKSIEQAAAVKKNLDQLKRIVWKSYDISNADIKSTVKLAIQVGLQEKKLLSSKTLQLDECDYSWMVGFAGCGAAYAADEDIDQWLMCVSFVDAMYSMCRAIVGF